MYADRTELDIVQSCVKNAMIRSTAEYLAAIEFVAGIE